MLGLLLAALSPLAAQSTVVAYKEVTFGSTVMTSRIEVTDTTTQAQRDARKFSFSWTARLTKVFGSGTNGAQNSVQFAAMTTANNGAFYSFSTLASLSSNSTYDQTFNGTYVAPNSYVAGTEFVDIKFRASCVGPSTQIDEVTLRIQIFGTPNVNRASIDITNHTQQVMKYRVIHDGQVIDQFTLLGYVAGEDEAPQNYKHTYDLPNSNPLTVESAPSGVTRTAEGVWVVEDDENNLVWTDIFGPIGPVVVPPDEEPPDTNQHTTVKAPNPSPMQDNSGAGSTVWKTVNSTNVNSGATGGQIAEGMDKVVNAVNGLGDLIGSTGTLTEGEEVDLEDDKSGDLVDALIGFLPDMPTITQPATTSSMTIPFGTFGAIRSYSGGTYSGTFDFAPYAGPISVLRALCSGVLLIFFSIVFTKTLRSAFAGK